MENSNTEVEISFRFLKLDKLQAYTLVREILGSSHTQYIENNCYVGCTPLTELNFENINDFYVRQRVNVEACDIFVLVKSSSNTGVIDVPKIVNRMLKYIDCKLTYSFTIV